MIKATRSNTTTRRALLAGAPAVAAAALAAGTAANGLAIAATSPSGDAELLALKPEFDVLFDLWCSTSPRADRSVCSAMSATGESRLKMRSRPFS